jgi:hypothetical protein
MTTPTPPADDSRPAWVGETPATVVDANLEDPAPLVPAAADGQPWQPHRPTPPPGQGMGRALWIAWCILWAVAWGAMGLFVWPLLVLVPLSLFAIAIGRPKQVIVYPGQ